MTDTPHRPRFPDLPPIWLAGYMVVVVLIDQALPSLAMEPGLLRPIGFGLAGLGVALIFWSGAHFAKAKTPIEPGHTPKTLLATGPYRINRNPIYTGMAAILAGFSLGSGVLWGLVLVILFVQVINKRFIVHEERILRDTFGAEAEAYIAQTRRW
ncbi:MAG: isoprenylcysteine carboxylmethyltransferase family protein [Pseudomonadota bacterium]